MSEPDTKRVKMSTTTTTPGKPPVIGTHNGHFHADEALAVYLLRLLPTYRESSLIRTRDPELLATCDIVCDVGGVHDHSLFRYDHHQREFTATFPNRPTKLSSAGLVWMHYGQQIIGTVTQLPSTDPNVTLLWNKLYEDFIEAFDGNDNGISLYDPAALRSANIQKQYSDKGFSIASVVNRFNYSHPSPLAAAKSSVTTTGTSTNGAPIPAPKTQDEEDARFLKASQFVGEQFLAETLDKFHSWLPAREIVQQAFQSRHSHDASGSIIVIPQGPDGGVPWMDHLYALESENKAEGNVLYALFAENGEPDAKWRIRAVSLEPGSFENRKSLPEAWKGVRDEQLSEVSGVPGGVFVHAGGFIGGNKTFEGALEMAKRALAM
ncbi:hypothetical protein MBLNU230_g0686t1 [Neophaeotheca triangularis]